MIIHYILTENKENLDHWGVCRSLLIMTVEFIYIIAGMLFTSQSTLFSHVGTSLPVLKQY